VTTNQEILQRLLSAGRIDINRSPLFDTPPPALPEDLDFTRVEGMMLGLAVGDALGSTSESMPPPRRREILGFIDNYLPHPYAQGKAIGLPTDDTQLAFWTLEQMLADNGLIPGRLAERFRSQRIFGLGSTVRGFLANYKAGQREWYECGPKSAGNGALMRIAPLVIPHLKSGGSELWADTALAAMLTHNDSASIASCLALIGMLWHLLGMDNTQTGPAPLWYLDTFVAAARKLEKDAGYRPRGGKYTSFEGTLWQFVDRHVRTAYEEGLPVLEACESWHSGAYLLETVPCVLYIMMLCGHNLEEAVLAAVNDTRDNDTIAAVVGALSGALHGRKAIPARWLDGLPGRTGCNDDGRIYELLQQARSRWGCR
jgi:ADP-ribosyl-[dinitrogen reductase] hydrolase